MAESELVLVRRCCVAASVQGAPVLDQLKRLQEAGDLVDVSTGHADSGVVAADSFGVRCFKQAVHVPSGIVKQFDLTDAELVDFAIFGLLRDLRDCFVRQHEILVKVHELWHRRSPWL